MRMWEIREGSSKDHYGRNYRSYKHDKSVEEAYECGYEDGYEDAMEEFESERSYRGMRKMGR